jgi:hypothetical protein
MKVAAETVEVLDDDTGPACTATAKAFSRW